MLTNRLKRVTPNWTVPVTARLLSLYFRYSPGGWGKARVWRFCEDHIGWRSELAFNSVTEHGIRLRTRMGEPVSVNLFFYGIWESGITDLMRSALRPGDTFVDVGANIGYHSLLASKLVGPAGRVIALEPAPQTRDEFICNLNLNPPLRDSANIDLLPYCAYDRDADVVLHVVTGGNSGLSSIRDLQCESVPVTVKARPLDEILANYDLSRCPVVKMDIEGAEYRAVLGMESTLRKYPETSLILEFAPAFLEDAGASAEMLFEYFRARRYEALLIDAPKLNYQRRPVALRTLSRAPETECNILFTRTPGRFAGAMAG